MLLTIMFQDYNISRESGEIVSDTLRILLLLIIAPPLNTCINRQHILHQSRKLALGVFKEKPKYDTVDISRPSTPV